MWVYPRKADNLVHKPLLKGGALKSTATVVVHVCGQKKKTVKAKGSSPVFTDRLEFILGEFINRLISFINYLIDFHYFQPILTSKRTELKFPLFRSLLFFSWDPPSSCNIIYDHRQGFIIFLQQFLLLGSTKRIQNHICPSTRVYHFSSTRIRWGFKSGLLPSFAISNLFRSWQSCRSV